MGNDSSMEVFEGDELKLELEQHEGTSEDSVSYWNMFMKGYNSIVNTIIRPPRHVYSIANLGPIEFTIENKEFIRTDFCLPNERKLRLEASLWGLKGYPTETCVIYLHSLSGSRVEVLSLLIPTLLMGYSVVSFDFSGSGRSEGEFVSMGYHEYKDIKCVLQYLHMNYMFSSFMLWGRSMGANAALLLTTNYHIDRVTYQLDSENGSVKFKLDYKGGNQFPRISSITANKGYNIESLVKTNDVILSINGISLKNKSEASVHELLVKHSSQLTCEISGIRISKKNSNKKRTMSSQKLKKDLNLIRILTWSNLIIGSVFDSAFSDLEVVLNDMINTVRNDGILIPTLLASTALSFLSSTINRAANFNIFKLKPDRNVRNCHVPAVFIHSSNDDFVLPKHCDALVENYGGLKTKIVTTGVHDGVRSDSTHREVLKALLQIQNVSNVEKLNLLLNVSEYPAWCDQQQCVSKGNWKEAADSVETEMNNEFPVKATVVGHSKVDLPKTSHIVYEIDVTYWAFKDEIIDNFTALDAQDEIEEASRNNAEISVGPIATKSNNDINHESANEITPGDSKALSPWRSLMKLKWKKNPPSTATRDCEVVSVSKEVDKNTAVKSTGILSMKASTSENMGNITAETSTSSNMADGMATSKIVQNRSLSQYDQLNHSTKRKDYVEKCITDSNDIVLIEKSYRLQRRFHDVKIFVSELISYQMNTDLNSLRTKMLYSTKFGQSKLHEREKLLSEVLSLVCSIPELLQLKVTIDFLELPNRVGST